MKELKLAIQAAKEAGKIQLKYFRHEGILVKTKNPRDLLTKADLESEEKIISILKQEFPDYSFLAEESGLEQKKSKYMWVIDPLDGTGNFFKGHPDFCTMIALVKNNQVLLGVIYFPVTNELFVAEKGKGAKKNGKPISVSKESEIRRMYANTHMSSNLDCRKINLKIYNKLILQVRNIHVINACVGRLITDVAEGISDFHFKVKYTFWDYGAGTLLLKEAGGQATDLLGNILGLSNKHVLLSNGQSHNKLLKIIKPLLKK